MATRERQTFPLVPRRRLVGLPFGDLASRRRGHGSDVIGTRAYATGDPVASIDWFASARLSAATGRDEFIVRDRAADEAPRVALVVDRRPAMGVFPAELPWLSKPRALAEATAAIVASATAARSDVASLDFSGGDAYWIPPGRRDVPWLVSERQAEAPFDAGETNVEEALEFLGRRRADLPTGTFVFVVSDFLAPPPPDAWVAATAHGWDMVPVVIQDPVWEQGFPDVAGVVVPVADPRSGRVEFVRLTRGEVERRRAHNEQRLAHLVDELTAFGGEPVVLGTSDPFDVDRAFLEWAELRRQSRWLR
ncbi:MAG: DUF58 domain-containing protein [Gaiellaceae bacterium]